MRLILYSKPGCHLCEGLQEKLEQIHSLDFDLEIRDITTRDDWFQQYQYEIPVLVLEQRHEAREIQKMQTPNPEPRTSNPNPTQYSVLSTQHSSSSFIPHPSSFILLPRPSPRASVKQLEQMLQKYWNHPAE